MLSGSSPLPHRVSAHFVARREFFKRIRDSLHCVRRTLRRGALPSHFKQSVLLAALLRPPPHNDQYGQQCPGSEKKQGKATTRQNKPLPFEFDVAVVDSQWLTNTDKYRTFVSCFLSTALLPHVVLLLPLPLPASPPLALGTELSMLIAVQV